jgi:hypothetical protein
LRRYASKTLLFAAHSRESEAAADVFAALKAICE